MLKLKRSATWLKYAPTIFSATHLPRMKQASQSKERISSSERKTYLRTMNWRQPRLAPSPDASTMHPQSIASDYLRLACELFRSTPDTGCTVSLLNLKIAKQNGIQINRTRKIQLYHEAEGCMEVEGMARINVCAHDIQATLDVAISSDLKENMLISKHKHCIIPQDFHNSVKQNKQLQQMKTGFFPQR